MTEAELHRYEEQARKVLESHHVKSGYDLAPTILILVKEVRRLQEAAAE